MDNIEDAFCCRCKEESFPIANEPARWQMGELMNKKLPKTPRIWINGRRVSFRPECAECGLIADEPQPKGWEYVELTPDGDYGYVCPQCQTP